MTLNAIAIAIALAAAPQETAATAPSQLQAQDHSSSEQLSSRALARGESELAIRRLELALDQRPEDPALLINLGIALAQIGEDAQAQTMFERALVSSEPVGLETAEGKLVDSRRLARKAMRMLERGEFTPDETDRVAAKSPR
ncbi:MAG: tetratricopeptide repeat protein [Erythrobacter sp.]|jgi:tetratricopeptide (TPR) repeat protein|nr:tetratricopeptide repeat protein [Erythrobacter sp.]